jgi:hypothetical protein
MSEVSEMLEDIKKDLLPYESWERLSGESAGAFAAFCVYRDFGSERNIRKAAVRYADSLEFNGLSGVGTEQRQGSKPSNSTQTVEKRCRVWRNWAAQFKWRERAADYDRYIDGLKQTEKRKTIEAQGEVHRMITGKMLQVVNKKLDLMDPADLSQGSVTDWVDVAIKADRAVLGVVSGNEKEDGGKPGAIMFAPEFKGL